MRNQHCGGVSREDSNQSMFQLSLIRVFTVCMKKILGPYLPTLGPGHRHVFLTVYLVGLAFELTQYNTFFRKTEYSLLYDSY